MSQCMIQKAVLAPFLLLLSLAAQTRAQTQTESPRMMIVMDGSGSMWGQIDGRAKLEIARDTVAQVLKDIPANQALGLLAYGHRRKGDCSDIELMVPPGTGSATDIVARVNAMRFLGKTPLSAAVREAAEALRYGEEASTVVLVTDGLETCDADPCALGRELEATGLNFTAHVIGFGLTREEGAQVACLAENTGGQYIEASDAAGLSSALSAAVTAASPPPPKPAPTTAPAPLATAGLIAPETAPLGSMVSVEWTPSAPRSVLIRSPSGAWRMRAIPITSMPRKIPSPSRCRGRRALMSCAMCPWIKPLSTAAPSR